MNIQQQSKTIEFSAYSRGGTNTNGVSFIQARNIIFSRDYNWEIKKATGLPAGLRNKGSLWVGEHVASPDEGESSVQAYNMTQKSIKTIFTGLQPYECNTPSLPRRWICHFTDPE